MISFAIVYKKGDQLRAGAGGKRGEKERGGHHR